jgi:pimeloyl-ACP methyl ester carboxylesterase
MILGRRTLLEQWTDVNGRRVFARVGQPTPRHADPPLVLVHGLGVSSRYMVPLAEELAPLYPTFAPDLPGFGRSARPPRTLTLPELARALRQWMQASTATPAVLIGNSMGCQVIVELADLAPESIRGAVLLGPTMDPTGGVLGQVTRLLTDQLREPLSLVPLQALDCLRNGPVRTAITFRHAIRQNMLDRADRLSAATLLLRGERDPIVSDWFTRELARRMPRAVTGTIRGAGHALNYNSPRETAARILAFIESL